MNEPLKIYFADLTYTTISIANDVFPLNIGFVSSYVLDKFGKSVKIVLFKYIDELEEAIKNDPPDVLACSHYFWNDQADTEFAKMLKKNNPHSIVIWGGPDFPADMPSQKEFMDKHVYIDFYVPIEGEIGVANIIGAILKADSKKNIRKHALSKPLDGCISRKPNGELQYSEPVQRLKNLDEIPSPYLSGLLDKFFDGKLSPMLQTNRGCPFQCSFCTDGSTNVTRVNQFNTERVAAEIEYIAKHIPKNTHTLYISDLNFGMFPRDIEICKTISKVQEKYHFPLRINATTGKNQKEKIIESIKTLSGTLRLMMSVQSMDEQVLKNVKRQNISTDQMLALAPSIRETGLDTYAECILGLPGETYQSHLDTIHTLIKAHIGGVVVYACMLLDGAEMQTPEYRQKWGFKTKFRPLHKAFTELSNGKRLIEIEELVSSTNTLSFKEYVELRVISFILWIIYDGNFFKPLIRFLQEKNIDIFDLVMTIFDNRNSPSFNVKKLTKSFEFQTENELWDSPEELRAYYEKDENYQKLLNVEVGMNVVLYHYADLVTNYMKEWNRLVFSLTHELLEKKQILDNDVERQFQNIVNYCNGQSHNLFGKDRMETNPNYKFEYDVKNWVSNDKNLPLDSFMFPKSQLIHFVFSKKQFDIIENDMKKFGKDNTGISRMLFDINIETILRTTVLN
jgi:radical SAM superfamily enzyme YgiQ (UPF0313 family)